MIRNPIKWYAASLVDILGQADELDKLNELSLDEDSVKEIIKNTYEKVKNLRNAIDKTFETVQAKKTVLNDVLPDTQIKSNSFSDLVVSYVPLVDESKKIFVKGIYHLLLANGGVFLQMLANNVVMRGGIDIGRGVEHSDGKNELYGAALSNAYKIESKYAIYPRIVIGKHLYEYLQQLSEHEPVNEFDLANVHYAKMSINLLKKDCDGEYILDYISEDYKELPSFDVLFMQAKAQISLNLSKYSHSSTNPVYKKYQYLDNFFLKS